MKSAYISYSRQDQSKVTEVAEVLSQLGYKISFDTMQAGEDFLKQIVDLINKSDIFFFVVSEESLNSQWCRRELDYALKIGKRIIPIAFSSETLRSSAYRNSILANISAVIWDENGKQSLRDSIGDKGANESLQRRAPIHPVPSKVQIPSFESQGTPAKKTTSTQNKSYGKVRKNKNGRVIIIVIVAIIIAVAFWELFFRVPSSERHHESPDHQASIVESVEGVPADMEIEDWDIADSSACEEIPAYELIDPSEIPSAPAISADHIEADTMPPVHASIPDEVYGRHGEQTIPIDNDSLYYEVISSEEENESVIENEQKDDGSSNIWIFILLAIAFGVGGLNYYKRHKIRIKLVANVDCIVYVDNKELIILKAKKVSFVFLSKGQYYLTLKPVEQNIEEKNVTITVRQKDEVFDERLNQVKQAENRTIKCFIAGSTKLEAERNALRAAIAQTHNNWRDKKFEILSYTYEDFERKFVEGGHQKQYDYFIENEATLAVFIISGEIGNYTITEFEKALNAFKNGKHPQILVFNNINAPMHEQSEKLKAEVSAYQQYWSDYDSINYLRLQFMHTLDWMIYEMK